MLAECCQDQVKSLNYALAQKWLVKPAKTLRLKVT